MFELTIDTNLNIYDIVKLQEICDNITDVICDKGVVKEAYFNFVNDSEGNYVSIYCYYPLYSINKETFYTNLLTIDYSVVSCTVKEEESVKCLDYYHYYIVPFDTENEIVEKVIDSSSFSHSITKKLNYRNATRGLKDSPIHKLELCEEIDLEDEMKDYNPIIYNRMKYSNVLELSKELLLCPKDAQLDKLSDILYCFMKSYICTDDKNVYIWNRYSGHWLYRSKAHIYNEITTILNQVRQENEDLYELCIPYINIRTKNVLTQDLYNKLSNYSISNLLDNDRRYIGTKNRVIDIYERKIIEYKPTHYLTMSTKTEIVDFKHKYEYKKLLQILKTIFPDSEILKFFLLSVGSFLDGYNKEKFFYIWIGKGDNGKSLIQRMLSICLGDYCTVAPTSLITGRRGSKSTEATPALAQVANKLVSFFQEPSKEERLNIGMIKELTGNDKLYVRELYKNPKTINMKSHIVLVTNNYHFIPDADMAFKRRLVVIPFVSQFIDPEDYDKKVKNETLKENVFKIDTRVEDFILDNADICLSLIMEMYNEYKKMGLHVPEIIKKHTNDYLTANNSALRFIRKFLKKSDKKDIDEAITITEVYSKFKSWHIQVYPAGNRKIPDIVGFELELENENYIIDTEGMFLTNAEYIIVPEDYI